MYYSWDNITWSRLLCQTVLKFSVLCYSQQLKKHFNACFSGDQSEPDGNRAKFWFIIVNIKIIISRKKQLFQNTCLICWNLSYITLFFIRQGRMWPGIVPGRIHYKRLRVIKIFQRKKLPEKVSRLLWRK